MTLFDDNIYFATSEQIDNSNIYIIDPDGIHYFKTHYKGNKEIVVVYLKVKRTTRFLRMLKRGDDLKKALHRIKHDNIAFNKIDDMSDYIIPNNDNPYKAANIVYRIFCEDGDIDKYKNK